MCARFVFYLCSDLAANTISTIADEMSRSDAMPKFLGTTAINMPGSIAKDQALTKIFGVVGGAARVPAASFALFTMRDVATMAAAFTLPTPMSAKVRREEKTRERRGKGTRASFLLLLCRGFIRRQISRCA